MEKYIAVTKENREFLIKTFRTTKMAVWRALTFVERGGDSPRARKIRQLAQWKSRILNMTKGWNKQSGKETGAR